MIQMLEEMVDDESSLISLYFGADVKKGDAAKMKKAVEKRFDSLEVELQEGGQPVYYYVTSVE